MLSADSQTQAVGPRSPHSTARGPARPQRGLPAVPTWSLRRSPGFCSFSERSSPSGSVSKSQGAGRNFGLWSRGGLGTSEPEGEMKSHLWSVILLFIYLFFFSPLDLSGGSKGRGQEWTRAPSVKFPVRTAGSQPSTSQHSPEQRCPQCGLSTCGILSVGGLVPAASDDEIGPGVPRLPVRQTHTRPLPRF